jgi:protein-tyrosine phosphatase
MRTGPVALDRCSRPELAQLAGGISALTHASADTVEACVLWTDAIRRAIDAPVVADGAVDWVRLVADGLEYVPEERRSLWSDRLEACRTTPPEQCISNGYVVTALQAALSSLAQTPVPGGQPCRHLRVAIERAVRIGDDTDTVAAITGSLAGAYWGATAVPLEWRSVLNGRATYDTSPLAAADLDRLARLAFNGGVDDNIGWPTVDSLLPYYASHFPASPLAAPIDGSVTVGNVHALPAQVADVDVVVSLCRMGRHDVPDGIEHQVIGLLDTTAADNPNLGFVLADTADYVARCAAAGKRVFVHRVRAENRTPAVAAAYLMRTQGLDADAAIDRVEMLTRSRPQSFLTAGLRELAAS